MCKEKNGESRDEASSLSACYSEGEPDTDYDHDSCMGLNVISISHRHINRLGLREVKVCAISRVPSRYILVHFCSLKL